MARIFAQGHTFLENRYYLLKGTLFQVRLAEVKECVRIIRSQLCGLVKPLLRLGQLMLTQTDDTEEVVAGIVVRIDCQLGFKLLARLSVLLRAL